MPFYIKANPKVAQYLGLTKARSKTPDGNYLLWQADLNVFGGQFRLDAICAEIGATKLTPLQQKRELEGSYQAAMPVATDPRFVMPEEAPEDVPQAEDAQGEDLPATEDTPEEPAEEEPSEPTDDSTEAETNNTEEI